MAEANDGAPAIKAGDVVYLASDAASRVMPMTVGLLRSCGEVDIYWVKGNDLGTATVPVVALRRQ